MIPLATHRKVWAWFCLCATDKSPNVWKQIVAAALTFGILVSFLGLISASGIFVMRFWSTDIEGCLYALFQFFGFLGILYTFIIGILFRKDIAAIFVTLTKIHNQSQFQSIITHYRHVYEIDRLFLRLTIDKNEESYRFLVRTNERSEWLWRFVFKVILMAVCITIITSSASILICYFTSGVFNANHVYHPYKLV